MMKFRDFFKKHRAKTIKGTNQFAYQNPEPSKQFGAPDTRAPRGIDNRNLPPDVIPPTFGKAG
jgi:hypothetical protein